MNDEVVVVVQEARLDFGRLDILLRRRLSVRPRAAAAAIRGCVLDALEPSFSLHFASSPSRPISSTSLGQSQPPDFAKMAASGAPPTQEHPVAACRRFKPMSASTTDTMAAWRRYRDETKRSILANYQVLVSSYDGPVLTCFDATLNFPSRHLCRASSPPAPTGESTRPAYATQRLRAANRLPRRRPRD